MVSVGLPWGQYGEETSTELQVRTQSSYPVFHGTAPGAHGGISFRFSEQILKCVVFRVEMFISYWKWCFVDYKKAQRNPYSVYPEWKEWVGETEIICYQLCQPESLSFYLNTFKDYPKSKSLKCSFQFRCVCVCVCVCLRGGVVLLKRWGKWHLLLLSLILLSLWGLDFLLVQVRILLLVDNENRASDPSQPGPFSLSLPTGPTIMEIAPIRSTTFACEMTTKCLPKRQFLQMELVFPK